MRVVGGNETASGPTNAAKSRELINEIAFRMIAEGRTPVQRHITDEIYNEHGIRVSPNLAVDQMREFWSSIGPKIAQRFSLPDVPHEVNEAFVEFWRKCNESAQSTADRRVVELERDFARLEEEKSSHCEEIKRQGEQIALLMEKLDALQSALGEKSSHCEDLKDSLAKSHDQVAELKANLAAEVEYWKKRLQDSEDKRVAEVRQVAEASKDEITKLVETHDKNQMQWDGLRKFLMVQTDELRDSMKSREEFYRKQAQENDAKFTQLKIEFSQASDRALREIGKAEAMREELLRARAELDELRKSKGSDCPAPWDIWVKRAQRLNIEPKVIDLGRDYLREFLLDVIKTRPSELGHWVVWSEKLLDFCHRMPKQSEPLIQSLLDGEESPESYFHAGEFSENVNDNDQDEDE